MLRTPKTFLAWLFVAFAVATFFPAVSSAISPQDGQSQDEDADDDGEITLEEIFPEDGLFGPQASGAAFSHDGRYAAYLYRPYKERRHGNDLWLVDVTSGEANRATSVSVMAEFQKATKEVQEDRIKKAEAESDDDESDEDSAEGGDDDGTDDESDAEDDADSDDEAKRNGDWVGDDDADDDDAPRYGGVGGVVWSPNADELLFVSGGDVYRYFVDSGEIVRLTKTQAGEAAVDYTPDGQGLTFIRGEALLKVTFDSHFVEELEPPLPSDENMTSYQLSEDGKRLAFLTYKGEPWFTVDTVKIVNYRGRFAQVTDVPRTVSDSELPDVQITAYVYQLPDEQHENGTLYRAHAEKMENPQDIFSTPSWSADSSRAAFTVYEYTTGLVSIYEAIPPEADQDDEEEADGDADDNDSDDGSQQDDDDEDSTEEAEDGFAVERPANLAYRFLHFGGPNTPSMMQPEYLADNRRVVVLTEQTGFRQLHVIDPVYQSTRQLTSGNYEVIPRSISKDRQSIFVTANRDAPGRDHVFQVDLESGEMAQLTTDDGVYSNVAVSPDGSAVLANHVTYGQLTELALVTGGSTQTLTDSHPEKAHELTAALPEFFTYENRHGHTIHGMMFKPDDWSAGDKRPLLIYVYGGPLGTRKMVTDGSYSPDPYFFAWYMAKKHGYVTVTIDPRGVSGYGGLFEKSNFDQIGKPQVEDLVDGAKFLIANHGVDEDKVGIHGWSFGGFQTQMCMYTAPDVFAVGMAGAGPTEWENYNAWYTSGTIGPSKEGEATLKKFSLLPLAKNLEGKLLLIHGMEDANVLYQDTVRVYRELLQAGKETLVELFVDPTGGHGLGGDVKRLNKYRKYEEFLLRTLGEANAG